MQRILRASAQKLRGGCRNFRRGRKGRSWRAGVTRLLSVAADDAGAEVGEGFDVARRTGVVRAKAALLGSEAKGEGDVKRLEGFHLAVKPALPAGTIAVGPTEAGAELLDAEFAEPADGVLEAMVLEMEPLADAELGRVAGKLRESTFGRAIFAKKAHVKVAIVGGAFGFAMASGSRPG